MNSAILTPFISTENQAWTVHRDCEAIIHSAVAQVAGYLQNHKILPPSAIHEPSLDIVLGNDAGVQQLNLQWRGIDKPTNVLSFPAIEVEELAEIITTEYFDGHCGDIYLAFETIEREAKEQNKLLAHHLHHLTIHSVLHIFGFDHQSDEEAEIMEAIEIELLQAQGIANPYELSPLATTEN